MEQVIIKKKNVSGMLYAEDFSLIPVEKKKDTSSVEDVSLPEEINSLSEGDIEEAYQRGLQEGGRLEKELWEKEKKYLISEYNQKISQGIENILSNVKHNRDEISRGISSIFFRTLINIFPEILKKYGAEESKKTIDKIARFIDDKCEMKLTCSKEFSENIEGYILKFSRSGVDINIDESLVGGDFKISWNEGSFSRNVNEIISEMEAEIFSLSHEEGCENVR